MPETLAAARGRVGPRPCATKLESAVVIIVTRQNFYIFWQMASPPISRRFWGLLNAPTRRRDDVPHTAGRRRRLRNNLEQHHSSVVRLLYHEGGRTCVTISLPSTFQAWASESPASMAETVIPVDGSPRPTTR